MTRHRQVKKYDRSINRQQKKREGRSKEKAPRM